MNAFRLMDAFWPGPLTIILEKNDIVPAITSGNLASIGGVRMPDHKIPLELIKRAGAPLLQLQVPTSQENPVPVLQPMLYRILLAGLMQFLMLGRLQ